MGFSKIGQEKRCTAIRHTDGRWDDGLRSAMNTGCRGGVAVMLIPARTDTKAFHEYIYGKAEIRFIRGRLRFGNAERSVPVNDCDLQKGI